MSLSRPFPTYVDTYVINPGEALEATKPEGKIEVSFFPFNPVWVSAGGNAGPVPAGDITDGTGSFVVGPDDSLLDRTFDVSAQASISFYNSLSVPVQVGIAWS